MPLTLKIENHATLPDGGPLSTTVSGGRGLDIGRAAHLDWTLPDPDRVISSKHCEVRRRDGAYWLTDVSTNGTFLNGSDKRLTGPHRLRDGDRLTIGHYIISVSIQGEDAVAPAADQHVPRLGAAAPENLWDAGEAVSAPPVDRAQIVPPRPRTDAGGDFIDWVVDDAPPRSPVSPAPVDRIEKPAPIHREPAPANVWGGDEAPAPDRSVPPPLPPMAPPPPLPPMAPPPVQPVRPADMGPPPLPSAAPPPPDRLPPARIIGDLGPSAWSRPDAEPPAARAPEQAPPPPAHAPLSAADADLLARFAKGAGLPETMFAGADPGQTMERAGALLALVAMHLKQMLAARAETRRQLRAAGQTHVEAVDNNPLKMTPDATEALRLMFGPQGQAYLPAESAFAEAFSDLKVHQIALFEGMREAIGNVLFDFAPEAIEAELDRDGRGRGFLSNRKAQAWDMFATRWAAKAARHDNGIVDTFLIDLARCYDRYAGKRF